MKNLKVGEIYWIFDGQMKPVKATLTELVNEGRTAIFGVIARKITSAYSSKEEALNTFKY